MEQTRDHRWVEGAPEGESAPEYDEDGIDLTLLRWMVSLTPTERLQVLQSNVASLQRLLDGRTRG